MEKTKQFFVCFALDVDRDCPIPYKGERSAYSDYFISKYSYIIKKSCKILKTEKWGLLNLPTKIKRNRKGIFIHFKFEGENKIVKDIEKKLSVEKEKGKRAVVIVSKGCVAKCTFCHRFEKGYRVSPADSIINHMIAVSYTHLTLPTSDLV